MYETTSLNIMKNVAKVNVTQFHTSSFRITTKLYRSPFEKSGSSEQLVTLYMGHLQTSFRTYVELKPCLFRSTYYYMVPLLEFIHLEYLLLNSCDRKKLQYFRGYIITYIFEAIL